MPLTIQEQAALFKAWLAERHKTSNVRLALSGANKPYILPDGFRFAYFNLESTDPRELADNGETLIFSTVLVLPPGDARLQLAMVFQGEDLVALGEALDQLGEQRTNNVRLFVHHDGVYLRAKGEPLEIAPNGPDADAYAGPVRPTRCWYADVDRPSSLLPVEVAHVQHLASLLDPVPLTRLGPLGETGGRALDPATVPLVDISERISGLGGMYGDDVVARYHAALNHQPRKHFVLLTGISGTGKTLLARAYAYAILGISDLEIPADDFFIIPVQPSWSEPVDLLGFFDPIAGDYRRTPFLRALLRATHTDDRPIFVCLDEMNLAQPEHYFSDFLSAMETGERIQLHDDAEEEAREGGVPRSIPWPSNLYITGTVNIDETTRRFSPRLLDRANAIDLSDHMDIPAFVERLSKLRPELAGTLDDQFVSLLVKLHELLHPHGLHFGYRSIQEIAQYVAWCAATDTVGDAVDRQIDQKILTKLRGGVEQTELLTRLAGLLNDHPNSHSSIERMKVELENYEFFQYWR